MVHSWVYVPSKNWTSSFSLALLELSNDFSVEDEDNKTRLNFTSFENAIWEILSFPWIFPRYLTHQTAFNKKQLALIQFIKSKEKSRRWKKLPDPEDYNEKTTKMQNKILERKKANKQKENDAE